jgi:hypothetical protein
MSPIIVSRIIAGWISVISILLTYFVTHYSNNASFYRFGPQHDLVILGFSIDTPEKYAGIVIYAIINTVIRNLDQNIITPWITLNVQNVNAPLAPLTPHTHTAPYTHTAPIATRIAHSAHDTRIAMATDIEIGVADISSCEEDHKYIPRQYEISITNTIYSWFDWLIYIHMLLAQIDMFLIEVFTDILAICIVTRWYIKNKTV